VVAEVEIDKMVDPQDYNMELMVDQVEVLEGKVKIQLLICG
jgi:hypothetical protein